MWVGARIIALRSGFRALLALPVGWRCCEGKGPPRALSPILFQTFHQLPGLYCLSPFFSSGWILWNPQISKRNKSNHFTFLPLQNVESRKRKDLGKHSSLPSKLRLPSGYPCFWFSFPISLCQMQAPHLPLPNLPPPPLLKNLLGAVYLKKQIRSNVFKLLMDPCLNTTLPRCLHFN